VADTLFPLEAARVAHRSIAWRNFRKAAKAMGGELYWRYRMDK
jgi:hypothetical protein